MAGETVRKFFEKRKRDAKFKAAGPGHRLTDSSVKPESSLKDEVKRHEPCPEARQAGMAALARFQASTSSCSGFSFFQTLQDDVRSSCSSSGSVKDVLLEEKLKDKEKALKMAVEGVFYRCPAIGNDILEKEEWRVKIRSFLNESLEEERGLSACLIIRSCNRKKEKVEQCVSTLSTCLENIINHPEEEKYKRIRVSNKIFQEKVMNVDGAMDFLLAAGFESTLIECQGKQEEFLVYNDISKEKPLSQLLDALKNSEPIRLELDRNLKVLLPAQASIRVQIPDEFYALTQEEIKREQQLKSQRLQDSLVLKTKAMREKEEQREMKKYKFTVIRIRFPDGIFLQGTFGAYEKLQAVREFVDESLAEHGCFILSSGLGNQFSDSDYEATLFDLRLIPASLLIFAWHPDEIISSFLKEELLALVEK